MKKILYLLIAILAMPITSAVTMDVVQTDPAPVESGETVDITVRLQVGPTEEVLHDVSFHILRTDLIRPVSQPKTFSELREGDTVTATVTAYISDDAPDARIPILFRLRADEFQQTFEERLYITDTLENPEIVIGAIETVPNELLKDSENNDIEVTLNNLGDKAAKQVRVDLHQTESFIPSYTYAFRDTTSQIPGNTDATFTFTGDILEDVDETIPSALDIRYKINEETGPDRVVRTSLDMPLPLSKSPFLEVVNVSTQGSFEPGSNGNEVFVTVRNTGDAEAEDVRIRAFPDISYPYIFSVTTKYVASILQPGDETTVSFDIEVLSDAEPRSHPIRLELESLVETTRYERQDEIQLSVNTGPATQTDYTNYIIFGIVFALAAGIGVYRYRNTDS